MYDHPCFYGDITHLKCGAATGMMASSFLPVSAIPSPDERPRRRGRVLRVRTDDRDGIRRKSRFACQSRDARKCRQSMPYYLCDDRCEPPVSDGKKEIHCLTSDLRSRSVATLSSQECLRFNGAPDRRSLSQPVSDVRVFCLPDRGHCRSAVCYHVFCRRILPVPDLALCVLTYRKKRPPKATGYVSFSGHYITG